MRFCYSYQGKTGEALQGIIASSSQAEAYSALRKSGIRPMKVWPAPGLLNRMMIGRRWTAIIVLSIVALVAVFSAIRSRQRLNAVSELPPPVAALPRQQCADVEVAFAYETEKFLALFARPGDCRPFAEWKGSGVSSGIVVALPDLEPALQEPIRIESDDTEEAVVLKRIVMGLKDEVRKHLASGSTQVDVVNYLVERQRMEAAYRESILERVKRGDLQLMDANAYLRAMGLRPVAESELRRR